MKIDFYHIDAFEVANYEAIWRALRAMGVDANLVAVNDARNTAAANWFNFDLFKQYCDERALPFVSAVEPGADLAVTTQNADILRDYSRRVRLMYGPAPYFPGWAMSQRAVQPFDAVLVHGRFHADWFSRWLRREQLPVIGYPRYDELFSGQLARAPIRARWGVDGSKPVLMFLPTWAHNTAFDTFFPALLKLREKYQIVLRPHHCTLRMEAQRMALMRASGLLILEGAYDLPEAYAGADVVVSDVRSGSLFEACAHDLPSVGMVHDAADLTGWLAARAIDTVTPLCQAPAQLESALEAALSGKYAAGRRRWADYHVAYRDGTAAQHAAEALIRLAAPHALQVVAARVYRCKVSVILPTYNHAEFLPQAVESILKQRLTDFELIIVNDGSTDHTGAYLETLQDPRIKVIERENGGLPSALNCGFAEASGEYRTWTSADNVVGQTWLGQLVAALDSAPPEVGFACSAFALINAQGQFISVRRGQNLQLDSVIARNPGIASFLYRTTVAEQVGDYDAALTGAEDWDMWLRILEVCDPVYVDDLLYYYRVHGNSMTSTIPEKVARASAAALERLRQRHGGSFDLDRLYPRLREAEDLPLARWQARSRLAASLIDSPFASPNWAAQLLVESLHERYAPEVQGNLVHLLCRCGAWDLALQSIDAVRHLAPSPQLDELRALVQGHDERLMKLAPVSRMADGELAFKLGHARA